MTAIFIFSFLLIIYFIAIGILIRKGKVKNKDIITITPPNTGNNENTTNPEQKLVTPAPGPPITNDPYLSAIAEYLLAKKNEPFKIIKFLNTLPTPDEKIYLSDYLKFYDTKLYDTLSALSGIDLGDLEEFSSSETPIRDTRQSDFTDNINLSIEEDLIYGGIPYHLFEQEIEFTNADTFGEYINQLYEIYISRVLSANDLKHIDEIAEKITIPQNHSSQLSPSQSVKLFQKGESVALTIQQEIQQQNNV